MVDISEKGSYWLISVKKAAIGCPGSHFCAVVVREGAGWKGVGGVGGVGDLRDQQRGGTLIDQQRIEI